MKIAVVGLNHQTASAAIRERASFTDAQKIEFISRMLDQSISEAMILSTCGRMECYFVCKPQDFPEYLTWLIGELGQHMGQDLCKADFYVKEDEGVISHLIQVAIGLNSIVLGEDQILGQLKMAHTLAREMGATKRVLNVVMRDVVAAAKAIKTHLKISEIPLSLSYIGVKCVKDHMTLEGKGVLMIGFGEMGQLAYQSLKNQGAKIFIANRHPSKVHALVGDDPFVEVIPYEDKLSVLDQVSLVVCSTSAPHTILEASDLPFNNKNLVVLDLSLPRDVDLDVLNHEGVTLINIDTIQAIVAVNEHKRLDLIQQAEGLINDQVATIMTWINQAPVHETLKDLGTLVDEVYLDAMSYLGHKLTLTHHEQVVVEKTLKAALKRMVRNPILNLKKVEDPKERMLKNAMLKALFEPYQED